MAGLAASAWVSTDVLKHARSRIGMHACAREHVLALSTCANKPIATLLRAPNQCRQAPMCQRLSPAFHPRGRRPKKQMCPTLVATGQRAHQTRTLSCAWDDTTKGACHDGSLCRQGHFETKLARRPHGDVSPAPTLVVARKVDVSSRHNRNAPLLTKNQQDRLQRISL